MGMGHSILETGIALKGSGLKEGCTERARIRSLEVIRFVVLISMAKKNMVIICLILVHNILEIGVMICLMGKEL